MTEDETKKRIMEEWEKWSPDPNSAEYQKIDDFCTWLWGNHWELFWKTNKLECFSEIQAWIHKRTNYGNLDKK